MLGYSLVITALSLSQTTGRIVPDTKWDLVADPWGLLGASTRLWDPGQGFGQIRFQAYGYLWPMGPFFGIGDLLALPGWVIQRLWWALLLNLAFFGILLVLRAMKVGVGWTQVVAAASFVLALRASTLLGANSVELWPTAIAPWVLLALIKGTEKGSVVKWAALAALAVTCAGGVNATAASAVLPMGVIWILTRAPGPRRWRLLGWWTLFTGLACLWWLAPLALFGSYSPPILGYMENSAITQSVTGLTNTLLGTSDWVPYLSGGSYPAGWAILTTPFVLADAAAVVALGILGICLKGPHRRFATWSLLVGMCLVGFGYAGAVSGLAADSRQNLLDGSLAALRNTHKFDGVLRLALAIGVAHALSIGVRGASAETLRRARATIAVATALVLCGLAFPWLTNKIASPGGFEASPTYWDETAQYLAQRPEDGTALVVPAAPFGDYTWGSTHDDVLQPLATSPWASRLVLPLAAPGNVVLLDRITALLESGRSSPELVDLLRDAGVGQLVIRNDLNRFLAGAPDPAYVHATVDATPGLVKVAGFGPEVGLPQVEKSPDGRVVTQDGISGVYPSVEIYRVLGVRAQATLTDLGTSVMGAAGQTRLPLTADLDPGQVRRIVVTDRMRRQETAFQGVRGNSSSTQYPGSAPTLLGSEMFHRYVPDQERWQTTLTWRGVQGVFASASQADADQSVPLDPGSSPSAAFDADRSTAWRSPETAVTDGQWLQVNFSAPRDVQVVRLSIDPSSAPVQAIRITAGDTDVEVTPPPAGESRSYRIQARDASSVRVTAVGGAGFGQWAIAEMGVDNLVPTRYLQLPTVPKDTLVDRIELQRAPERSACPDIDGTVACQLVLAQSGEDGDDLNRLVPLNTSGDYTINLTASMRRMASWVDGYLTFKGVSLKTNGGKSAEVADSMLAMADGDPGTTWRSGRDRPRIDLEFAQPREINSVQLDIGDAAAVSGPSRVRITRANGHSVEKLLDDGGRTTLPGWTTKSLSIQVLDVEDAFDHNGVTMATGVSDLLINSRPLISSSLTASCGSGPKVRVNGSVFQTRVNGTLSAAMRGRPLQVSVCGSATTRLVAGNNEVRTEPTLAYRIDSVTMQRVGSSISQEASTAIPVVTGADGAPVSLDVTSATRNRIVSLPQNVNAGWQATLNGNRLDQVQVSGWQQGWIVPAGQAGTIAFDYPPNQQFRVGLAAGALGVLAVIAVALWPVRNRRNYLPACEVGVSGWSDVLVVLGAGLWLGGWIGAAGCVVVAVAARRVPDYVTAQVAAVLFFAAAALRIWPQEQYPDWLGQGLALSAVAVIAGSLLASGPTFLRRRKGSSQKL